MVGGSGDGISNIGLLSEMGTRVLTTGLLM